MLCCENRHTASGSVFGIYSQYINEETSPSNERRLVRAATLILRVLQAVGREGGCLYRHIIQYSVSDWWFGKDCMG